MQDLVNEGVESGRKLDPKAAVARMKEAKVDGAKRFDRMLSEQQIRSVFSRLAQRQRSRQTGSTR